MQPAFVDIHCHLLPGIDDGAKSLADALAMAQMSVAEGTRTIIATPHQLGAFPQNRGDEIRERVVGLQGQLAKNGIPLEVLPGADVRIEEGLAERIGEGEVVTLGDHRRHVLLELPHDVYIPLEGVLDSLAERGVLGILSHPERNTRLMQQPEIIAQLVDSGCLMQVTASSFMGGFGVQSLRISEWMLMRGLIHVVATDAHGPDRRRPLFRRTFDRLVELTDEATALDLCCHNPERVATGAEVAAGRRRRRVYGWQRYFSRTKAA